MTQVGRNHISWHGSVKNYRQAKRRIVEYLDGDGFAILNADDPLSVEILSELNHPALTYGMRLPAEITANVIEQHINEQLFVLSAGNDSVGVRTEMIGDHHVYNCLAAAAMALTYGIDLPAIARGLEAVEKLPGRMERVMCGQDYAVLVDAADSPDALRECFRAARTSTTGRLICVFGTHDDCDQAALPAIGRVLGAMTDVAFVTSQGAGDHSHRACMELRSGFAEPRRARVVIDRGEAIRTALDEARSGDTVVIAGMGERPHTPDADGLYLNDYEMVRRALHGSLTTTQPRSAA
jgi:UDP-N-acetylmuramoyl-L-alanyl-D-glutamate--2,6-diaminopimelate ligase